MTNDAQSAVQTAVYGALVANAGVTALIGSRVYDHVPADAAFPYVVIGETEAEPFDDKTKSGMVQAFGVHTWSRARGAKEAKDVMAAVSAALHRAGLTVTGHELAWIRFTESELMLEDDGLTRHGVQTFEIATQAA